MFAKLLRITATSLLLLFPAQAWAESGEELFKSKLCSSCHTVGGGKRVGPDLLGISERRSDEWLLKFIKNPQALADAGDADAQALVQEYAPIVMPPPTATDDEIRTIIAYLKTDAAKEAFGPAPVAPAVPATADDVQRGEDLFQGVARFQAGGPACTACHDVKQDAVIAGGILAKELTDAFSRLGGAAGVRAIIETRPFPVMQRAYEDAPLADEEIQALVAFLEQTDARKDMELPRDMGIKLFGSGVVGVILLLGLYSVIWSGRKRESVNQAIFDRQVKSI